MPSRAPVWGGSQASGDAARRQGAAAAPHPCRAPWHTARRDWAAILRRTWDAISEKDLSLVAAGVTYYLLLALFPGLASLVSIYGLFADPADVAQSVHWLSALLPPAALQLLRDALHQLTSASEPRLGIGAATGLVIAIYSNVRGMTGIMAALNIAYGQQEQRGYVRYYATALLLTAMSIIGGLVALALIAGLPALLGEQILHGPTRWVGRVIEWPLLVMVGVAMVALVYRYGPDRDEPQWRWASLGVITATILWILGSALFSLYIHWFGSYNRTYGSLGAPLVLLTWMWLSVFVVLFGAEIDGEGERQTAGQTTGDP